MACDTNWRGIWPIKFRHTWHSWKTIPVETEGIYRTDQVLTAAGIQSQQVLVAKLQERTCGHCGKLQRRKVKVDP